jgi:hypothetical protein
VAITFADVLAVADGLHGQASEPCQRSAVSRYFYAGLHGADHWLTTTPGMPSSGSAAGGMHAQLEAKLRNLDRHASDAQRKKGRVLAAKLGALKARRVQADYQLSMTMTAAEIAAQKTEAALFVADCQSP